MRELIYKSLTSALSKKRDVRIQETFEKDGMLAKTEKRCMYFVLGRAHIEDPNNIEKLNQVKFENIPHRKRHYYVLKSHDNQQGEDKLICKAAGTFYAVCGGDVYCIAFMHSFKISFINLAIHKGKDHYENT